MSNRFGKLLLVGCIAAAGLTIVACEKKEDPLKKAGEAVKSGGEAAKKAVEDAKK